VRVLSSLLFVVTRSIKEEYIFITLKRKLVFFHPLISFHKLREVERERREE